MESSHLLDNVGLTDDAPDGKVLLKKGDSVHNVR